MSTELQPASMEEHFVLDHAIDPHIHRRFLSFYREGQLLNRTEYNPTYCTITFSKGELICKSLGADKKTKAIFKSTVSHLKNCIKGFDEEYCYELEVQYKHFPLRIEVKGNKFIVNNFLGEKYPREVVFDNTKCRIVLEGKTLVKIYGRDKKVVSQTAATIEQATKVRNKDRRVFKDGIFMRK